MRQYLPTDDLVYKNIQTHSNKKIVFLSGLGMDIRKQREAFLRRFTLNQGVSYLALDYTRYALKNKEAPDYNIGQTLPKTMETLGQDNKKLFLFGVCYGGLMALKIAAKIPQRVAAVIAFSPPYETEAFPWIENTNEFLIKREEKLKKRNVDIKMLEQMMLFRQMIMVAFRSLGQEKIPPVFKGPMHIFHGQKDRLIPVENSSHVQKALDNPNCALHTSKSAGHTLQTDYKMEIPIEILSSCLVRN